MLNIQFQEIAINHTAFSLLEMLFEIFHRLSVNLYHLQVNILSFKKILRQYSHSRTNFQDIHNTVF